MQLPLRPTQRGVSRHSNCWLCFAGSLLFNFVHVPEIFAMRFNNGAVRIDRHSYEVGRFFKA